MHPQKAQNCGPDTFRTTADKWILVAFQQQCDNRPQHNMHWYFRWMHFCWNKGISLRLQLYNSVEFLPLNAHPECLNVENLHSQNGKYCAVIVFYSQFSTAFHTFYTILFYTISCAFSTINHILSLNMPVFCQKCRLFTQLFNTFNIVFNISCLKVFKNVDMLKTMLNMCKTHGNYIL